MEPNVDQERQQAHANHDHVPDAQVSAACGLFEAMLDSVSRALASAPEEDEEISAEEEAAVARSKEWFKHNEGIPFEQVVTELGFSQTRGFSLTG